MTKTITHKRISFSVLFLLVAAVSWVGCLAPQPLSDAVTPISTVRNRVSAARPVSNEPDLVTSGQRTSLSDVIELAKEIHQELTSRLTDYEATLVKRERINGKLGPETSMQIKVRNPDPERDADPGLSVYLRFLTPRSAAGREVIWRQSLHEGKLIAHEGGFKNFLRVTLDPLGRLAMMGNKYPITEIGLIRMVEKLIEKGERDRNLSSAQVTIEESHEVDGRPCRLIEVTHPEPTAEVDFHIARIFLDSERRVPLRYAAYLWPEEEGGDPVLEEEYTYLDLQLNVGLTEEIFDPDNPKYKFP